MTTRKKHRKPAAETAFAGEPIPVKLGPRKPKNRVAFSADARLECPHCGKGITIRLEGDWPV